MAFRSVKGPEELQEVVKKAEIGGRRVLVYVDNHHVCGLQSDGENCWRLKSNPDVSPPLTMDEIADRLVPHKREGRRVVNVFSIKSESKK